MDAGELGFIFHVGIYNYFAYDDLTGVSRRNIMNGSEWYYGRLTSGTFRPPAGSASTKKHHETHYHDVDYFDVKLNINRESIKDWLELCKELGATYVILTSRHHDGYCLWDTQTTTLKSKKDLVQIFKEEAELLDLKFGIYYSWLEFNRSMTIKYFNDVCVPQLLELIDYSPDMFWFDGDWEIKQKGNFKVMDDILEILVERGIRFNDRLGKRNKYTIDPSYRVSEDRFIPEEFIENWQHINTIGLSWGYNKEQESKHYKSGQDLADLYIKVTELGGSLLLNIATDSDGNIDQNELQSLCELYEIINEN